MKSIPLMKYFFSYLKITGKNGLEKWLKMLLVSKTGVNSDSLTKVLKMLPEGTGSYISMK